MNIMARFFSHKIFVFWFTSLFMLTNLASLPSDLEALLHDHPSNARYAKQELGLSAAKAALSWYIEHRFTTNNKTPNNQNSDKEAIRKLMMVRDLFGLLADCCKTTRAPVCGTLSLAASCRELYKTFSLDAKDLQEKDVSLNKLLALGELIAEGYAAFAKTKSFTDLTHKELMDDVALFARLLRGENDSLKYILMLLVGIDFISNLIVSCDVNDCDQVLSGIYRLCNNSLYQGNPRLLREDYRSLISALQQKSSAYGYIFQPEVQRAFRDALSELIIRMCREEDRLQQELLQDHVRSLQTQNQNFETSIHELTATYRQLSSQNGHQPVQQRPHTPSASQSWATTGARSQQNPTFADTLFAQLFGLPPQQQATQTARSPQLGVFGTFMNTLDDVNRIIQQTQNSANIRAQEQRQALNRRDELNAQATELPTVQIAEVNGEQQFIVRRAPPAESDDTIQPVERYSGVLPVTRNNPGDLAAINTTPADREILVLACNDLLEVDGEQHSARCPSCQALRIPEREAMLRIDPLSREQQQTHWRQPTGA